MGYSTYAKIAQVQIEGKRKVTRNIPHFNLDMIISVGYRVNSKRGTQFRIWANKALLMIAESRADEKDIILKVIVNLINRRN